MSSRRSEEEIRSELAAERQRLVESFADLRASVEAKKRPAARAAGAIAAGAVALLALKVGRALKR
jgi:hypothetical protein